MKKIHRLLFHVIAHIYHSHYKEILLFKLHPHLNTLLLHFMAFNRHFRLLEDHKETDSLDDLYAKLVCAVLTKRHPDKVSAPEANGKGEIPGSREGDGQGEGGKDSKSRQGTPSPHRETLPPPPSAQELEENFMQRDANPSPTPPPPEPQRPAAS